MVIRVNVFCPSRINIIIQIVFMIHDKVDAINKPSPSSHSQLQKASQTFVRGLEY